MPATPSQLPETGSLALLTDLYQLTMAYGYWKSGCADREAVFHLFFRTHPFGGGYTVAAGLAPAVEYLRGLRFTADDTAYLATLCGNDGTPLFEPAFLEYLRALRFTCDLEAVPEGSVVFPHEPLLRVRGPLLQAQLVETALLTIVNFQSLVATKAARIVHAARGDAVLEFGLRRAQGVDGGLAASRAAFIGGCHATSNVLAGRMYGIPVRGTHAHSWVMAFGDELEAFRAYARAMPHNCVLLVDTYDTLQGVRNAIRVGRELRRAGHRLAGVRLDSGDLAYLSIQARRMLDEAGFTDTPVLATNDLDEATIESLRGQDARVAIWGVGTRLVTAYDHPALGGVYKLAAVRDPGGEWQYRLKLSEQLAKVSNPGVLQVRRFYRDGEAAGDMIWDEVAGIGAEHPVMVDPMDATRRKRFAPETRFRDLLVPVLRGGEPAGPLPSPAEARDFRAAELEHFHAGIKRFTHPHTYPVGLERGLNARRTRMVARLRRSAGGRRDE